MPFFLLIVGSDCTHFFHFSAAKAIVSLFKNCPEYCNYNPKTRKKPRWLSEVETLKKPGFYDNN
ncbi:hypothetical protein D0A37_23130 [Microcoleus vaginatus HSN003]|nr:hypothetical protein D0A37_23130 [Microcoleus vaginatus HSN003]